MEQVTVYPVKKSSVSRWWFITGFFVLASAPFLLMFGHAVYVQYRGEKAVDDLAHALQEAEKNTLAAKMRDTVGGKTPQETLQLYIVAVEKGDYELASKYFIERKQAEELQSLQSATKQQIIEILSALKQALNSKGGYSDDKSGFAITKPVLVDFEKYPNGVWKIIEI